MTNEYLTPEQWALTVCCVGLAVMGLLAVVSAVAGRRGRGGR